MEPQDAPVAMQLLCDSREAPGRCRPPGRPCANSPAQLGRACRLVGYIGYRRRSDSHRCTAHRSTCPASCIRIARSRCCRSAADRSTTFPGGSRRDIGNHRRKRTRSPCTRRHSNRRDCPRIAHRYRSCSHSRWRDRSPRRARALACVAGAARDSPGAPPRSRERPSKKLPPPQDQQSLQQGSSGASVGQCAGQRIESAVVHGSSSGAAMS